MKIFGTRPSKGIQYWHHHVFHFPARQDFPLSIPPPPPPRADSALPAERLGSPRRSRFASFFATLRSTKQTAKTAIDAQATLNLKQFKASPPKVENSVIDANAGPRPGHSPNGHKNPTQMHHAHNTRCRRYQRAFLLHFTGG